MKSKIFLNHLVVILTLVVAACASKKDDAHRESIASENEWKEMDDFHMIMAETFHPYKDSANLEPVKARAAELFSAADRWASATLPKKVDTPEVRAQLRQLKSEAATLVESVKSSDDNVIGDQLAKLHDTFHAIQEEWYH